MMVLTRSTNYGFIITRRKYSYWIQSIDQRLDKLKIANYKLQIATRSPIEKLHVHKTIYHVYLNYTYYINILEDAYGC